MSILRKISSFAATTLVAAAPLCIGFCSAPLAQAAPSDTPATSISTPNPAGQPPDLTDWAKNNCPGGEQFVNDADENTPIYLGYAAGKTFLGYTTTNWGSEVNPENQFIDTRSDDKFKEKIGTCVRVAADKTGQPTAKVFYGTLFKADKAALAASSFSEKTQTVFQVTKVKPWDLGTKVASRSSQSSANYQEMPHSAVNGSSDSGFVNTQLSTENSIELSFTRSGFYTIYLKALTTDPQNPDKSYQAEMAYTFIVGKEARVPEDLQDIVDGKDGDGSDNPPTPDPGETTPVTPTPHTGDKDGNSHPGTNPPSQPATGHTGAALNPNQSSSSRLQASSRPGGVNSAGIRDSLSRPRLAQPPANAFPTLPDPATGSSQAENPAGTNPGSNAATSDSAATNGSNSDSQAANGDPLKFQADSTSTDLASKQWVRSSSLAVFAFGLGAAGLTGIGLLIFSRLHP
ncbi:hypothetical protein [Varibaculum cambriense]|uniref:hypothetical protein n=1 Tax=Varibaculum cambriense TaxID=184870 RepID=UPI002557BD0B|nr:hypothetical protein [Varibaculum cambriense]MDK8274758.1 hypothetical protein [Varibaculum cambriense]